MVTLLSPTRTPIPRSVGVLLALLLGFLPGCIGGGVWLGDQKFDGEWGPPARAAKVFLEENPELRELAGGRPRFESPSSVSLTIQRPGVRIVNTSVRLGMSAGQIEVVVDPVGDDWEVVEATLRHDGRETTLK